MPLGSPATCPHTKHATCQPMRRSCAETITQTCSMTTKTRAKRARKFPTCRAHDECMRGFLPDKTRHFCWGSRKSDKHWPHAWPHAKNATDRQDQRGIELRRLSQQPSNILQHLAKNLATSCDEYSADQPQHQANIPPTNPALNTTSGSTPGKCKG